MFVLTHAAIIIAISLVVGRSITTVTDTGHVRIVAGYPGVFLGNPHPCP